jgi:hypothetical protein
LAHSEFVSAPSDIGDLGRDYLIERSKRHYDRRQRDRNLKSGDRVAILGRGIAVVEQIDGKWIQAVVWNKCTLRIARKEIVWFAGRLFHWKFQRLDDNRSKRFTDLHVFALPFGAPAAYLPKANHRRTSQSKTCLWFDLG